MEYKRWENLSELLPKEVEDFVNAWQEREEVLKDVEEKAKREKVPILLPSSAQLLRLITELVKPKTVLEIGTGIGYSTLNLFFACPQSQITTVDSNSKRLETAKSFFKKAGAEINAVLKDGLSFVNEALAEGREYELIFVDATKSEYPFYNYKVQALLKRGVIIFDNALFRGYVAGVKYEKRYERGVKLLRHFLNSVKDYPNFKSYLIPVGDGLLVMEKLV
ncbi:O-methyltransferase [Thermovibrio sp.]